MHVSDGSYGVRLLGVDYVGGAAVCHDYEMKLAEVLLNCWVLAHTLLIHWEI